MMKRSCFLTVVLGVVVMTSTTTAMPYLSSEETDLQAVNGPIIYPMNEKKELILQKGQNFTLTCKGNRPIEIRQQTIPEEVVSDFRKELKELNSNDGGENSYNYEVALDLYNVDQYAVGYYACFDDVVSNNSEAILDDITEEPTDTPHVTYIYIYVNGTDALFAPMSEFWTLIKGSKTILQCRPTMPDVKMTVSGPQSVKTPEIIKFSPKIGFLVRAQKHFYQCNGRRGNQTSWKLIRQGMQGAPKIKIQKEPKYFLEGETFSLNCSVEYQHNSPIALNWTLPRSDREPDKIESNENGVKRGEDVYNAITIVNATREDAGLYTCVIRNGFRKSTPDSRKVIEKKFLEKPYIHLTYSPDKETTVKSPALKVQVDAYPKANISFLKDNQTLVLNSSKYKKSLGTLTDDVSLTIINATVNDIGNYTFVATNGYVTETATIDLKIPAPPVIVDFGPDKDIIHLENTITSLRCEATGYPLPSIDWIFSTNEKDYPSKGDDTKKSEYRIVSYLKVNANESGNMTCKASSKFNTPVMSQKRLLVYEIQRGFGIDKSKNWYSKNDNVALKCLATKYQFSNLTWRDANGDDILENVTYFESKFSHVARLKFDRISLSQAGMYTCVGQYILNGTEEHQNINIEVKDLKDPEILEPQIDKDEIVQNFQSVGFSCVANAVPPPIIEWYKDGELLVNNTNGLILIDEMNQTIANSTVIINKIDSEMNIGKYECLAISAGKTSSRFINLRAPEAMPYKSYILGGIAAVILILIVLVIYLTWKIKKEKRFRKELAAAGLLYFKEGVTKSLNPDLGIDEQAELLPYDEKFEYPAEKLKLGKQLGAGAFGVVYKAEARGIVNAEENTPVAVKMVKKTADNMYIKALASELKIMVHLGKHINIVNLLGACTRNVGKRELIVIVEYCKFGNIHNYMQKHREVFIDQLTDNKEKNLGRVNRGYSCSSGSSGMNSDYFGNNHTQATDHTFLNTANSNRSTRKVSETGYVQPEWRSNYESDYSFDGRNPRPLTSRDLLAWAFQIARGMEYLASRKVLHGDLAARNVLLAEDNIVKICDFGLARSIYKNDEYQKKENSPLPVKWLAIECMTDRIFSTQSDIWSFGIVLWEMFSLAKTPYPNMSPQNLLQWLSEGHRLEKPPYADDRLYDVMLRCWEHKPNTRPSFSHLQELLGSFLEDNVRNHYVDLNSAYMDMNVKTDGEDYLAMVSAPDYNNLVTPSPHHYMNDAKSFFPPTPTQVPLDEEGYLQMTPVNPSVFSPRNQTTKFDFDANKIAEGRGGSELTPMLRLGNLPARGGSESDHEGGHSPYLKMAPRISEESDEVFKPNQNNAKNIQNSAVSNPTYISLELDNEKKPQDIINYINIPNGLVK